MAAGGSQLDADPEGGGDEGGEGGTAATHRSATLGGVGGGDGGGEGGGNGDGGEGEGGEGEGPGLGGDIAGLGKASRHRRPWSRWQHHHGPIDPGEEMPDPNGDGKGGPTSNVAFGAAELGAVQALEASAATQGAASHVGDAGIITVGGHDAVADDLNPQPLPPGPGSFWDQAAGATQGATAVTSASAFAEIAGLNQAATTATETSAHDVSSALDSSAHTAVLVGGAAHDAGFATVGFDHAELGTAALHDSLSLGAGAFANQMHI